MDVPGRMHVRVHVASHRRILGPWLEDSAVLRKGKEMIKFLFIELQVTSLLLAVAVCPFVGYPGASIGHLFAPEPVGEYLHDKKVPEESSSG